MKKINDWYEHNNTPKNKHIWLPDKNLIKNAFWEEEEINFERFLKNEDKKKSELERRLD